MFFFMKYTANWRIKGQWSKEANYIEIHRTRRVDLRGDAFTIFITGTLLKTVVMRLQHTHDDIRLGSLSNYRSTTRPETIDRAVAHAAYQILSQCYTIALCFGWWNNGITNPILLLQVCQFELMLEVGCSLQEMLNLVSNTLFNFCSCKHVITFCRQANVLRK